MRFSIGTFNTPSRLIALLLGLCAAMPSAAAAQQTAAITGRVVDQSTQAPILGAEVAVRATSITAMTDRDGRYSIQNVSAGMVTLVVRAIGYGSASRTLTVSAGGSSEVNFGLSSNPIALDAVVVTAT